MVSLFRWLIMVVSVVSVTVVMMASELRRVSVSVVFAWSTVVDIVVC